MPFVTVPGGTGPTIAVPFASSDNAAIAEQLLQGLYYASPDDVHVAYASAGLANDQSVPGDVNEFIDDVPGQVAVPNGYQYLIGDYALAPDLSPVNSFIANGAMDGAVISLGTTSMTYQAGTGVESIVAGGNITFSTRVTGGGSGQLYLDGGGMEAISLASGTWSVSTGTGTGTVTLGSGSDSVTVNGIDTVTAGTGAVTVTLDHGQDVFKGGNGPALVVDNGGRDSVTGGNGRLTVFGQTNALRVQGGGGEVLFIETAGGRGNTVIAGSGGAVVFGGPAGSSYQSGGSYFFLTSGGGSDTVTANAGSAGPIVFGSPGGRVKIVGGGSGSFVVAGAGSETIDASAQTQGVTFFSGTGNADLIGGHAANFYAASTGNTTMSGGSGNVYEFINGHAGATNVITDFTPSDSLYLAGFGTTTGDGIRSEVANDGTLDVTLADGTLIVFENLDSPSDLTGHIHNI